MAGKIRKAVTAVGETALASGLGAKLGSIGGENIGSDIIPAKKVIDGYRPIVSKVTGAVIDHVPHFATLNADQIAQATQAGHNIGTVVGALALGAAAAKWHHNALRKEQFDK